VNARIGRNLFAQLPRAEALPLVRRALGVAPHLSDPWVALAVFRFNHEDDPAGAIRALKRALVLAPSSAEAHDLLGRILLEAAETDDARRHLERALWLDERQRWARIDLIRLAALEGDFARAAALYDEGRGAEWTSHRKLHRARIWSWPGAPAEGPLELPAEMDARFRATATMFETARAVGRGERVLDAATLVAPYDALVSPATSQGRGQRFVRQLMAEALMVAGHRSDALAQIEHAVDEGLRDRAWITRAKLFDPLRGEPRFEAASARVVERAARVSAAWQGTEERLEDALAALSA
jgi:serine/threonine-protein kinase